MEHAQFEVRFANGKQLTATGFDSVAFISRPILGRHEAVGSGSIWW